MGDRDIDHATDTALLVVAELQRQIAAELAGGPLREDGQGPTRGVAAEQRALRAPQDLDPFEVEKLVLRQVGDGGAVDGDPHAVVAAKGAVADAPDGEAVTPGQHGARDRELQIGGAADLGAFQRLRRERADRHRYGLGELGDFSRGDDNSFQRRRLFLGRRLGGGGGGGGGGRALALGSPGHHERCRSQCQQGGPGEAGRGGS